MNYCGIKMVDNMLKRFGIYEEKAFEDIALVAIRKFLKKFHVNLNVVYFIHLKCMIYFFMYEYLNQFFRLKNK